MRRIAIALPLVLSAIAGSQAASPQKDAQHRENTAWARSLDRETIRRAALEHERDPLSPEARERLAPVLLARFDGVPFIVCLDQVPGVSEQGDLGKALLWQIVFGSGVFLEDHPELLGDREAYMVAGLESAVRAYRNVLARNPGSRIRVFDELDELEREDRLLEHVRAHDCREDRQG